WREEHVAEDAFAFEVEAAFDCPDARDPTWHERLVPVRPPAHVLDVLEELADRRVVAVADALHDGPGIPAAQRGADGEPREARRQAVPVALRAHPALPDRLCSPAPGLGGISAGGIEDGDVLHVPVAERGMRDEPGQAAADHGDVPDRGHLTEPANRPCTKYRWKAKKTASGMTREMNDAGAMMSMFAPNWRRLEKIATVIG